MANKYICYKLAITITLKILLVACASFAVDSLDLNTSHHNESNLGPTKTQIRPASSLWMEGSSLFINGIASIRPKPENDLKQTQLGPCGGCTERAKQSDGQQVDDDDSMGMHKQLETLLISHYHRQQQQPQQKHEQSRRNPHLGANGIWHRHKRSDATWREQPQQQQPQQPATSELDTSGLNDGHLSPSSYPFSPVHSVPSKRLLGDDAMQINVNNNNNSGDTRDGVWMMLGTNQTTTTTILTTTTHNNNNNSHDDSMHHVKPKLMMTANKDTIVIINNRHNPHGGSSDRAQQQQQQQLARHNHANDGNHNNNNNNSNNNIEDDGSTYDNRTAPADFLKAKAEPLVAIDTGTGIGTGTDKQQQDLAGGAAPMAQAESSLVNQQVGVHIIKLIAPESIENGTGNVTMDCLLKYDKTFDRRLTIKWFHNDDVVPIYQYIPELNSRTYSDKWEPYLDKSYDVTQDPQMILASYMASGAVGAPPGSLQSNDLASAAPMIAWNHTISSLMPASSPTSSSSSVSSLSDLDNYLFMVNNLLMDETTRYRGLKLIRPTSAMSGKFTCSVSSLESYDTKSSQLIIYAPAKGFQFEVNKVKGGYNITCQAEGVSPEPRLHLYRYRSSFIEPDRAIYESASNMKSAPLTSTTTRSTRMGRATGNSVNQHHLYHANWIANSMMRPESIHDGTHNSRLERDNLGQYHIATYAYIDESTLSSQIATQFECALSIEATNYRRQKTLALQRGWHTNTAAITNGKHNMIGLISGLASLIIVLSALVSIMMVFKLLRSYIESREVAQAPSP